MDSRELRRSRAGRGAARSRRSDDEFDLIPTEYVIPTEYERRSCAGTGPRLRAMWIRKAREDPAVELGDPLSAAAAADDAELVRSLLQQGADPNHLHFTVNMHVPLARTSSAEVAQALLEHPDVDVNVADINSTTVLEGVLLHHGDAEPLLSALLSHERLDVRKGKPLSVAARFAQPHVLTRLLDHPGVDVNDPANAALHGAISRTDERALEVVEALLRRPGVDVNLPSADSGATPLHSLSRTGSLVVEVGQSEKTLRREAAARQVEMARLLLARPDVDAGRADERGCTALHEACEKGRLDIVRLFLSDRRFEPSAWQRDLEGQTPLCRAVAELAKDRPRWNPLPCTADHAGVIAVLARYQRARLREVPPPQPLRWHPHLWALALDFVM